MLDLRRLRCFAAVAETLHFGRAAQRLHMAQPPLTRQISALEEELGFRLFDRSSRAVTLTAEGSLFLPYARALLDQLERTAGFARKLAQGLAGHLTLGYASSIALSDLFTEAIRLFRERHPEVQLELLEGASAAQWAQIAEGGIDVGLGRLPPPEGQVGIEVLALGGEPLVVAVQGYCYTIGIELMLAADINLCASNARFAQLEVQRGILPFGGATLRMHQVAGWGNAMRWLLTGDEFDAHEAYRLGLVQEVTAPEDLLDHAIALAERVAAQAPLGVRATLGSARQALLEGEAVAAAALPEAARRLLDSEDAKEGLRALQERRPGRFEGR
ncbi:crotonase/enoyl-CoA hydratase family protein [Pseudomonas aeruginosa]|nr:crotonase/enoyl-CoA hydratase family protein [Pseudomonas aeruginosa]